MLLGPTPNLPRQQRYHPLFVTGSKFALFREVFVTDSKFALFREDHSNEDPRYIQQPTYKSLHVFLFFLSIAILDPDCDIPP